MNHLENWSFFGLTTVSAIVCLLFAAGMAQSATPDTAVWERESGTLALVGLYLLLLALGERVKHLLRKPE
jgi:hypothetical protein